MNPAVQSHGSIPYADLRELQIEPSSIIDFSATVNPFPLPEAVKALFTSDGISAYPDTECHEARKTIADFHGIPKEWIQLSAGVTEIIYTMPLLYKRAAYFSPSYGDYAAAYLRYRRKIAIVSFPKSDQEFENIVNRLRTTPFRLLIVCNPNNPTGDYLQIYRIQELCELFGHATICIDESYQEMGENCDSAMPLITRFRNLLVLKSLTKPFGIGGLRAGYAISSGGVLKRIRQYLMPWGVSSLVQRIIPALLSSYSLFHEQWVDIIAQKNEMTQRLLQQGFCVASGRCPFFLVNVGNAEYTRRALLVEHQIAMRSCASFGMREWIRVMPGRPEDNLRLLDVLSKLNRADAK